ncbi:MAG TPA: C-terminal binding protein [Actinomycetota bacterium]|nr:C-terminal binding protein [Actinomycetota bacterium]
MGVVAVTDHVFPHLDQERAMLADAGHELRFDGNATTPEQVAEVVRGADAVLNCYTPIPADVTRAMHGCRIIARYGIGLDTIDVGAATETGIVVTNVPDYCIDEVSDHALALALALARGVVRLDRSVHGGSWSPMDAAPLHRLRDRMLGLVGFGRIARALAAKASAIGFHILAFDPFLPAEAIVEAGAEPCDLQTLLAGSDVVSLHAPLTPETHHLIGAAQLDLMREGAMLVNTSRGPLVDLDALRATLAAGHLGGAALDVLETEPPAPDDPLLARAEVIVTPHAAFYSEESMIELQRKATEQVIEVLAGRVPPYAVNAEELGFRQG